MRLLNHFLKPKTEKEVPNIEKPRHLVRYIVGGVGAIVIAALIIYGLVNVHKVNNPNTSTINHATNNKTNFVTISNGGLSLTFKIAWGATAVAIDNSRVANGLNIEDAYGTGRLFQVDQHLSPIIPGQDQAKINPTQAGAVTKRSKGLILQQEGSPVVKWSATKTQFNATILPLDFNTGNSTNWVYLENVQINNQGVANFNYSFYYHGRQTYKMLAVGPVIYTDYTGAFMYPLVSPYGTQANHLRTTNPTSWPVKEVTVTSKALKSSLVSMGWIANIDTKNNLGVFYTTPLGSQEIYRTYPGAHVIGSPPLGNSSAIVSSVIAHPGLNYSISFSVLVSTPTNGPVLISQQPPAKFNVLHD